MIDLLVGKSVFHSRHFCFVFSIMADFSIVDMTSPYVVYFLVCHFRQVNKSGVVLTFWTNIFHQFRAGSVYFFRLRRSIYFCLLDSSTVLVVLPLVDTSIVILSGGEPYGLRLQFTGFHLPFTVSGYGLKHTFASKIFKFLLQKALLCCQCTHFPCSRMAREGMPSVIYSVKIYTHRWRRQSTIHHERENK